LPNLQPVLSFDRPRVSPCVVAPCPASLASPHDDVVFGLVAVQVGRQRRGELERMQELPV